MPVRRASRVPILLLGIGGPCLCAAQTTPSTDPPAATPLDQITVTGTRAQIESTGVVLHVDVDPLEATDVSELLSTLPGVQVRNAGGLGAYSEASLRGSSGRQVRVLLDGLPLDAGGGETTSLSLVSSLLLESIDIYQGRVPVDLGAGLAGSINLRTRRTLPEPVVGTAGIGTLGEREFGGGAQLGPDVQLLAGVQRAENDFRYRNPLKPFDPDDPDRRDKEKRRNADTEQQFALLRWHGPLTFTVDVLDDDQNLPTQQNSPFTRTELDTRAVGATVASPDGFAWPVSLSWRYQREHYLDPDAVLGVGLPQDVREDTRDVRLAAGHDFGPVLEHLAVEHQEFSTDDSLRDESGPSARRLTVDDGLQVQWGTALRLDASVNLGWSRDESGEASSDERWRVEPALGLSRTLGDTGCLASTNVGHRKRLPTFFERYGDRGLFRGNPDLAPERSTYADLGGSCALRGWVRHVEVTAFGQALRDAISPVYTAQGVGRSINTSKGEIHGVEWSAGGGGRAWTWTLGGTWQHTEDRSDVRATRGRQLPGRFENQFNARLERSLPAGLTVYYAFRFESGQYYDSPNFLKADVLRRHDVGVRGAIRRVGWSLQWLNLGNEHFEQFNGFPTPGQRVRFSLTWPEMRVPAGTNDDNDSRSPPT